MSFLSDDPKALCNGWSIILTAFLESRDYYFIVKVETESQEYCDLYVVTEEGVQKRKKGVTSDINSSSFLPSYSLHDLGHFLYTNMPQKCFKALFMYGQQMKIPGWKGQLTTPYCCCQEAWAEVMWHMSGFPEWCQESECQSAFSSRRSQTHSTKMVWKREKWGLGGENRLSNLRALLYSVTSFPTVRDE